MTNRQRNPFSREIRPGHTGARRRRGTIMILVMTVLSILFVVGVAFMATMSFESELIRVARERATTQPAMADVADAIDELLTTGLGEIIDVNGILVPEPADSALASLSSMPFAQSPGRYNSLSPIEPYKDNSMIGVPVVWGTYADLSAQTGTGTRYFDQRIDTAWKSGIRPDRANFPDFIPVDADGDGIVDAAQVDIESLGFTRRQIDPLAQVLNPTSNPSGKVFLAMRTVPHGGMLNLTYGHPTSIRDMFSMSPNVDLPQQSPNYEPYSPAVEESLLRRRGMFPPRELPPGRILGSLLNPDPDSGGADFTKLYWPNETVSDHRYWPFQPDEFQPGDPNTPIWAARMNPYGVDPRDDQYDRRHLVTSISHSDLLRRASMINLGGGVEMDVVDWALENGITPLTFPYMDYPSGLNAFPNDFVGENGELYWYDWQECFLEADCELNPRKGRLRLSMGWLDEMWDWDEIGNPIDRARNRTIATETIQDVFTLMLLNARGSEWGTVPAGSTTTVWQHDFPAISRAAASLTANLIDFADPDDIPTAVTLRSADFTAAPPTFGDPLGPPPFEMVYGLEFQPFITEVAAKVVEQQGAQGEFSADPGQSSYAIELFNPYPSSIFLGDYFLKIESTNAGPSEVNLSGLLSPSEFKGYKWDQGQNEFPRAEGKSNLDFESGSTIELWRRLGDGTEILVDEFRLDNSPVGLLESDNGDKDLHSAQRYATQDSIDRWYAAVPTVDESGPATIGAATNKTLGVPAWQPVQAIIANPIRGTFSKAFPTTGSLLLLIRHANSENEPFTKHLGVNDYHPIDDGRMPIYDFESAASVKTWFHQIDPSLHPADESGTIEHLPWGQLVFDYFTALPLENPGPYGEYDQNDKLQDLRREQPRVDMDGMRAHGRIDLNAAPWFVMKGLPFIRMDLVPLGFEDIFATELDLKTADRAVAQPIGAVRAQAIAAYRDQRTIRETKFPNAALSGDYEADADFGRGWGIGNTPKIRRGMGFLSVGELANVRHPGAAFVRPRMRFDGGVVGGTSGTYLDAVAALACLSDWLSVRSQVFTVYGTLRGDEDRSIEDPNAEVQEEMRLKDVDKRAIRFQETIDRLPTFLGADEPTRIGGRVVATYNDVRND